MTKTSPWLFVVIVLFTFQSAYGQSNVGVGTTSPITKMDVNGAIALREGTAIALSNGGASGGTNDNIALPVILGTSDVASFYRIIGPTAVFSIYGIKPSTGADGEVVTLINVTGKAMTIINNNSNNSGSLTNGIITQTGANLVDNASATANSSITMQYNKTVSRWYVTATQNYTINTASLVTNSVVSGAGSNALTVTNGSNQVVGASNLTLNVAKNAVGQDGVVPGTATPANNNQVWGTNGSGVPAWGSVSNAQLANSAITVINGGSIGVSASPVSLGGTITLTNNGVTALSSASPLTSNVSATGAVSVNLTGIVPIANGGTNNNAAGLGTVNNFLVYNGTGVTASSSNASSFAPASGGNYLAKNSADVSAVSVATGGGNLYQFTQSNTTAATANRSVVDLVDNVTTPGAFDYLLRADNGGTNKFSVATNGNTGIAGTETVTGLVTQNGGLTETGAVNLNASGATNPIANINTSSTGTVTIGDGSSGTSTVNMKGLTANTVVLNNASGLLSSSAWGANNTVLHGQGTTTAPTFAQVGLTTDVTGILPVANGGTGSSTQGWVDLTTNQTAAGNKTWTGTSVIGASATSRATLGLTISTSSTAAYAANADITDAARQLSIVNEGATANEMATLSMRTNPAGVANNQMLDMKFVNPNDGTGKLIYSFAPGGTFTDRFAFTSGGNFGIGTTSPTLGKLQVTSGDIVIRASENSGLQSSAGWTNLGSIIFYGQNRGSGNNSAKIRVGSTGWDDAGYMAFETSGDGTDALERMRITETGNVGIGTTAPNGNLEVRGTYVCCTSGSSSVNYDINNRIYLTNQASDFGRTNLILTGRIQGANDSWSFGSGARNSIVFAENAATSGISVGAVGTEQYSIQVEGNSSSLGFLSKTNGSTPVMTLQQNGTVTMSSLGSGLVKATSGALSIAAASDIPSGSANYIQNTSSQQATSNFNISGAGVVGTTMTATTYLFPPPTGDGSPTISARVVPSGQGSANERTELILFHSNDGTNGAGPDLITLRAPSVRLQTYDNAAVGDITNSAGSNDRLYIAPGGNVGINTSSTATPASTLDVNGLITAEAGIQTQKTYRFWQIGYNCSGSCSGTWSMGAWDICWLAGYSLTNTGGTAWDDTQCNVYPASWVAQSGGGNGNYGDVQTSGNAGGNATYISGNTPASSQSNSTSQTYAYNSQPTWYMYVEEFSGTDQTTCNAMCMNFR